MDGRGVAKDYYQILNVPRNAEFEDIKQGYHRQMLRLHPDKKGITQPSWNEEEEAEQLQGVIEAWNVLSDLGRKAIYDANCAGLWCTCSTSSSLICSFFFPLSPA